MTTYEDVKIRTEYEALADRIFSALAKGQLPAEADKQRFEELKKLLKQI